MASLASFSAPQGWLSELQALLLGTDTLHEFLDRLAQLTVQELPAGTSCGVTVQQDSRPVTVAASDDRARQMDQLQYQFNEGPCLNTMATGKVHYVADTATETRWGDFCRAMHQHGVLSCLGLPLSSPAGLMGCYNLYSSHRDGFGEQERRQLEMFAGNAAGAVAIAGKLADQARLSEDLHQALTSRSVIDRATGIIMAQQRCDDEAAFDLLRRTSQHRNVKLRDLATEIVVAVGGASPKPGKFEYRHS